MITKLWADPEIAGRIYLQAQMLFAGELVGTHKDQLYGEVLHDVMHKLSAMRYHLDAYRNLEQQLYEEHRAEFQKSVGSNAECFPLIFAFEAFAFQLKSTLDMLVKILALVPLKQPVKTKTYGDKGDHVIDGLRANQESLRKDAAPDAVARIRIIGSLIDLMEGARDSWLREAVDLRDTVSHFKAAKKFVFTPIRKSDGTIDAERPVFERNGKAVAPLLLMESQYDACIRFCQEFMCRALNLGQPLFELMPAPRAQAEAVGGSQHASFIEWAWGVKGEAVSGYFNTDAHK